MDKFSLFTQGKIKYFKSGNISVSHAFSTRFGGISALHHTREMNLAYGRGDDNFTVDENYRLFCGAIGLDSKNIVYARQIHSCDVRIVTRENIGYAGEFDGMVTNERGVILCVKVADCTPILFYDEVSGVIGATHAGWRGACLGIAEQTVKKMCLLGAKSEDIQVAVGACIHDCCYEVGMDFYDKVTSLMGSNVCEPLFSYRNGKLYADIVKMNLIYLERAGIKPENISICGRCTACEPDIFFSHRATNGIRGTMAAIIALTHEHGFQE